MHHPTDRIIHTTAFVMPVHHERTLLPQMVKQRSLYMLFCLWDGAYKRTLEVVAVGFHSQYLSRPLPYVRHHITVNKMY